MTKRLVLAAVFLAATIALYYLTRPAPEEVDRGEPVAQVPQNASGASETPESLQSATVGVSEQPRTEALPEEPKIHPSPEAAPQKGMPSPLPQPGRSEPAVPAAIEEVTGPDEEVENVQFMVRGYRDALGENPVGNNVEITKALMGDNSRQVKMPLPVGSHLNEKGELSDRWGSPYFFHQLSAKEMEIRSAGPDQKMWTGDDILTR